MDLILVLGVTIIGGIIVGLVLYYVFGIGKQSNRGDKYNKSPVIKSGGDVRAGRDIVVGKKETIVHQTSAQEVPEFQFHLDARPTKPIIASVEKHSDATLVITSIDIAGVKTDLDRQFTRRTSFAGLNFPESFFENKSGEIKIRVRYRTLSGESYEYSHDAAQESRADGKFNIILQGNPTIKKIVNPSVVNNKQDPFVMDKWVAVKTENDQGADYRPIPLTGKLLEKVTFNIKPISQFWRAGLKIVDPNGSFLPLRSANSILFHLGSTETKNNFGITAYINGEHVESVNKILKFVSNQAITISFEVNQKNFVKFFVNETVEFEPDKHIDPRLLKKACLIAWGDVDDYRVEFDEIKFFPRAT